MNFPIIPKVDRRKMDNLSPEVRRKIGAMGGKAVSADPEYMKKIGSIGGLVVSRDREHMKRIGALGGRTPKTHKKNKRK